MFVASIASLSLAVVKISWMFYISRIILPGRASGRLTGSSSSARLPPVRLADELLQQVAGRVMPGGLQVTSPLRAAGFVTGFSRSVLLLAHSQCCPCVCLSLLSLGVDGDGTNQIMLLFICNLVVCCIEVTCLWYF